MQWRRFEWLLRFASRAAERGGQEGQLAPGPQGIRDLITEDV